MPNATHPMAAGGRHNGPPSIFEWSANWRRPSTGAKYVAIMVAISLFIIAMQSLFYAVTALVAGVFEAIGASHQLENAGVTLAAIGLCLVLLAAAIVIGAYWLLWLIHSKKLFLSRLWADLDLDGEYDEDDYVDSKKGDDWVSIALLLHSILTILLLHVHWHFLVFQEFSVNTALSSYGASFKLSAFVAPALHAYLVTIALAPIWAGVFWLGIADRRSTATQAQKPSRYVRAVPFLLCYAVAIPILVLWW